MIDSHCHLADEAFADDLEATVARAREARLTRALCILSAGDAVEAARGRLVKAAWPGVRFAAGVHPHNAASFEADAGRAADTTRAAVGAAGACAIGEIGLDYHYDYAPRPVQQQVFAAQVDLARALELPVIIHTRDATDDTFAILRAAPSVRGVFHCFIGDAGMARRALEIDFYLSFAGILTFPRANAIREAARGAPADRLLIETDSPYLAPVPHRGKRNEPAFVGRVLETLALVRNEAADELERAIDRNFDRLFGPTLAPATA
ncbi:MAG: TatD family hydrolase [Vicinamibacterales bacterium]